MRFGLAWFGLWALAADAALGQIQALPPSDLTLPGNAMTASAPMAATAPWPDGGQGRVSFLEADTPLLMPGSDTWTYQFLPSGLLYHSYLAGTREPRLGTVWQYDRHRGWMWDSTLGARVGVMRFGSVNEAWPEGVQLDAEGAAFPRLNMEENRDLDNVDFRFGFPITFRRGPWEAKFGYVHYCSHMGDEYILRNPGSLSERLNYVRDSLVAGIAFRPVPSIRLYSEADWAFYIDGGARPWAFQFGAELSPTGTVAFGGAPFLAVNGRIRQEADFGGSFAVEAGWQWRGQSGRLLRWGAHYFNGKSDQGQFYDAFEEQIGMGIWYDF